MIHLRSLGACEINVGGTRLVPTAQTLFATALYLAVEGARPIPREQMLTLLWPDADEEKGTHSLRQMFYKLRTHGLPLDSDAERVTLPAGVVSNDYESLLAPNAVVPVGELLARIPGGFLPGYMPRASRPFAEWVERQRAVVNSALRRQLVVGIDQLKTIGDWPATYLLAQRCLELDPLNEEATLALAEAMAMDGSKARAIMIIDRYMNEVGPRAPQLHLPATMLRKRISELYPLPPVIERDPPQTGRDAEMEKLDGALKDARQGSGSAFVISGPPGIGKTRLVTEFTRAAQLQGIPIARTGMGQHDNHRPLGAWSDLVPLLQRMPGALGCDPESLPYLKRLTTYDSKQTTPSPEAQDAEYLFARIRMSIIDLVSAVASESCLIVLIEDIHWMDEWSWDVMSALTKKLGKTGMLILMTRRDSDDQATPMPRDAVTRGMPLAPLDESRCRKLLGLVGPAKRVAEEDFVDWCVKTSAGNPYFLIELGRRASKTEGRFQAPPSLTRLITERFLDVAPLSRRVLQAAAVLGKNSTLARIETVLDEKRLALLDCVDELSRHSLILSEAGRVACRHDLLGMSVLSDASPLSLCLLHRHAARALESEINDESTPSHLWDCARHWEAAGEMESATKSLERCVARALETGASVEAASVAEYLITLLPPGAHRQSIRRKELQALHSAREYPRILSAAAEWRAGEPRDCSPAAEHSPEELYELDAGIFILSPTIDRLRQAVACASDVSASPDHRVHAGLIGLKAAQLLCDRRAAKRIFQSVNPIVPDALDRIGLEFRIIYEGSFGSVAKSASAARELVAILAAPESRVYRARHLHQCAVAFSYNGEPKEAWSCAAEALELALALQLPSIAATSRYQLAGLAYVSGRIDEAELQLVEFHRIAQQHSGINGRAVNRHGIRFALWHGDAARAKRLLGPIDGIWGGEYPRENAFVAEVRARVLMAADGWVPSDDDMRRLMRLYRQNRHLGDCDLFVTALMEAFSARNELASAEILIEDYVQRCRRERGALVPELHAVLARLSISAPQPGRSTFQLKVTE